MTRQAIDVKESAYGRQPALFLFGFLFDFFSHLGCQISRDRFCFMSAPGQVGRVPEKKTLGDDPVQIEAFCANARRNRSSVKVGTDHNRVVTDPVQDFEKATKRADR